LQSVVVSHLIAFPDVRGTICGLLVASLFPLTAHFLTRHLVRFHQNHMSIHASRAVMPDKYNATRNSFTPLTHRSVCWPVAGPRSACESIRVAR